MGTCTEEVLQYGFKPHSKSCSKFPNQEYYPSYHALHREYCSICQTKLFGYAVQWGTSNYNDGAMEYKQLQRIDKNKPELPGIALGSRSQEHLRPCNL